MNINLALTICIFEQLAFGRANSLLGTIWFRDAMFRYPEYFSCFCYETLQGDMQPSGVFEVGWE